MNQFEEAFHHHPVLLTEGALVERIKHEFRLTLDANVNHAGLIYTSPQVLETLYRQYIGIGLKYRLPVMVMTPTRRANATSIEQSAFRGRSLIGDACRFLNLIRKSYPADAPIFTGGLMGCRGDAYSGQRFMGEEEAWKFHARTAELFSKEDVDFLFAGIMPELGEATGMARALAETGIPYIISFMITRDGRLLDGTFLADAIRTIDEQVRPAPLCYMTNCIHPVNLIQALQQEENRNSPFIHRFCGIQANASAMNPDELNHSGVLRQDDFNAMTETLLVLRNNYNLKVFGGCCGTNDVFLELLARKMSEVHLPSDMG